MFCRVFSLLGRKCFGTWPLQSGFLSGMYLYFVHLHFPLQSPANFPAHLPSFRQEKGTQTLSGPISRDTAILSLRYPIFRGPQTSYETKPHMKQHCCCTWQGHPWLAISTVVAAENRTKDDVVSCRVCFVSVDIVGGICGPNLMKARKPLFHVGFVVSFMLGLERIL